MTSDLGLAHNFFSLSLVVRSNHIDPGFITAGITNTLFFTLQRAIS